MLAQSPIALEAVLNYNRPLVQGALRPKIREQIALVVAENNAVTIVFRAIRSSKKAQTERYRHRWCPVRDMRPQPFDLRL